MIALVAGMMNAAAVFSIMVFGVMLRDIKRLAVSAYNTPHFVLCKDRLTKE